MTYELHPKLPPIALKPFEYENFPVWADSTERFFSQYHLWDIATGQRKNPAGDNVQPSTALDDLVDLGDRTTLIGKPNPDNEHEVAIYEWNNQHSLAYNHLMNSLENHCGTYVRCATTKLIDEV